MSIFIYNYRNNLYRYFIHLAINRIEGLVSNISMNILYPYEANKLK